MRADLFKLARARNQSAQEAVKEEDVFCLAHRRSVRPSIGIQRACNEVGC